MPLNKPVTIIGGGLAGLALGIGLRQREVPVTVWEAGSYPRHRVCGEFISGSGLAVLERLGLLSKCHQAGAVYAHTVMFVRGLSRSPIRHLAIPALCLSRQVLDALLAHTFQQIGGELCSNARWTSEELREGLVRASGRRPELAEKMPRWFGIKAHVSRHCQVKLEADLEMHLARDGYIGVNRVGDGAVNVCGLFRVREESWRPQSKQDWLRGENGSLLRERLAGVDFDPKSVCSVAALELRPQRAAARMECCLGDTLTMTPPVTGNGMSMAFESAEMALEPLVAYSRGQLDWTNARRQIAQHTDAAFTRRLAWARILQWMLICPAFQGRAGSLLLHSEWLWHRMFLRTR